MTLQERIDALPEVLRIQVALEFLEISLPIWENFAVSDEADLIYYAEFYGLKHVNRAIVADSIKLAKRFLEPHSTEEALEIEKSIKEILDAYSDHNSGISHYELEIPYSPECVFYSAFNLLSSINGKKIWGSKSTIYISVNQSIDAITRDKLMDWDTVRGILETYQV